MVVGDRIINLLFFVFLIIISIGLYFIISEEADVHISEKYVEQIELENSELRKIAVEASKNCISGDKECQINSIYKYVIQNYNYFSDPRIKEYIQPTSETISLKAGDCEDLTILLNSLLESVGIQTYFVISEIHSFTLACDINMSKMREYILEDLKREQTASGGDYISLRENFYYYYFLGESDDELGYKVRYDLEINASYPIQVYIIDSNKEYLKAIKNEEFDYYSNYFSPSTTYYKKSFELNRDVGVMLYNYNEETTDISISFNKTIEYYPINLNELNLITYNLKNSTCIALESTAGLNGYPGLVAEDNTTKTAVDPLTREEFVLD